MMSLRSHTMEAIRQLLSSKLRAFLAVLGILVGTASVVAMISIGLLAEHQILAQFEKMGINLLSVNVQSANYNNQQSQSAANSLSIKSANKIITASSNISKVAAYLPSYGSIVYNGKPLQGNAAGVDSKMAGIAKLKLASGRPLSFLDQNDYFCLIGNKLYASILAQGTINPIGTQISVGPTIYTIVGVLKKWPTNYFFSTDFNQSVVIPLSTAVATKKNGHISNIIVRVKDTALLKQTQNQIKTYINKHTIGQIARIQSPKQLVDSMKKSSETMTILLGIIGSISLIVGGIGVMNVMLVSVAERHREIGIRLAVGARQKDIQMQFLIESITLSIFGGIAGMIIGILVTVFVALYSKWQFTIFISPPLVGCFVSVFVGVFFGFYPAWKASKLDPIQTLRSD